jgi:methionyl-tRNA formyltransferase
MRIAFLGSGAFGLPTLGAILASGDHEVVLVVSQPDRPAGRGLKERPTPVAEFAIARGLPLRRPVDVNAPAEVAAIDAAAPAALVIVAFGQKIAPAVLGGRFAINLHGSLLPRWRGAAPIQRAIEAGDAETGVCVISIAERMDAGLVYRAASTPIDPLETAAELHDRLAALGPSVVLPTLEDFRLGRLVPAAQEESLVTRARKIGRADTRVDPAAMSAAEIRRKTHAFGPKPGCEVRIGAVRVKLLRVRDLAGGHGAPGGLAADGSIACREGSLLPIEVQPAGGRPMRWEEFLRGARVAAGTPVEPMADGGTG